MSASETQLSTRLSTAEPVWLVAVAIDAPLRQTFDYRADFERHKNLLPGTRVRVPFGRREVVGLVVGAPRMELPGDYRYRALGQVLDTQPLIDAELLALCGWIADYYHHPLGEVLATALPAGLRAGATAQLPSSQALRLTAAGRLAIPTLSPRAVGQRTLLEALSAGPLPSRIARKLAANAAAAVRKALTLGWIEPIEMLGETVGDIPGGRIAEALQQPAVPSAEQAEALAALAAQSRQSGGYSASLLEGVTGSGKTEIYLQRTAEVIALGRQALVLTPEIGLTPQLAERYVQRFGSRVASYHSGLSEGQRGRVWLRARAGEIDVIVGTRSAVFAPLPQLGLIVVDEEHDISYKQQEGLRYSARDVALVRARRLGIPVLLGSATPALESLHNAQTNRYTHLRLHHRVLGTPPPRIDIVDVRAQTLDNGVGTQLLDAIDRHLQAGGQALLFLNRRGYAPTLLCQACGWVAPCTQCDARMVVHRRRARLLCHHCGALAPIPRACPDCGAGELRPLGQGTERIEEALRLRFPERRIERFDSDRLARAGEIDKLGRAAHAGEIDILVGTQVLAKGHDFAGLSLAGVVDADQALYGSDFRALERMGQLLVQVAGRVGRAGQPGQVLLQTRHPQHPLLRVLVDEGYGAFCEALLRERREHGLPPYTHLALIRAQASDEAAAMGFLQRMRMPATEDLEVLGPAPAPMVRRAGVHRAQLLLRCRSRRALHQAVAAWIVSAEGASGAHGLRWSVDVDPADLF